MERVYGTTIVAIRKDGKVCMACDTLMCAGDFIVNTEYDKIAKIGDCLVGVAGSVGDAKRFLSDFENLYNSLEGNLEATLREFTINSCDLSLEIEAIIINKDKMYKVWSEDLYLEIDENIVTAGSGENFALAAGRVLLENTDLSAKDIAEKSIEQASRICIATNNNVISKCL